MPPEIFFMICTSDFIYRGLQWDEHKYCVILAEITNTGIINVLLSKTILVLRLDIKGRSVCLDFNIKNTNKTSKRTNPFTFHIISIHVKENPC